MSIIDISLADVPTDQLERHIEQLKEYLRCTDDPNQATDDGQTCISIALRFCNTDEGIQILNSLIQRGGNPNLPSSFQSFLCYTTAATCITPLQIMIDADLELNNVYAATPGIFADGDRPFTLLDYALDINAYLNKNRNSLATLANKYAGGMGSRRRFIDDTIKMLVDHDAKRAEELI